jgi:hypothetical protein
MMNQATSPSPTPRSAADASVKRPLDAVRANRAADTGNSVIPRQTHDRPILPKVFETNELAERR